MRQYDRFFRDNQIFALLWLAKEFGLDGNNRCRERALFVWSIGRAFLKFWERKDREAGGLLDIYRSVKTGKYYCVDGGVAQMQDAEALEHNRLLWRSRVQAWLSDFYTDSRHVLDWLYTSLDDNANWLHNVDEHGRPRKLMKCGTLDRLVREADKAMQQALSRAPRFARIHEDPIGTYGEYNVFRLMSPEALDQEGRRMQHCIGNGAYDRFLNDPSVRLLSIRRDGLPVATIEARTDDRFEGEYIWQFLGVRNKRAGAELAKIAEKMGLLPYTHWRAQDRQERIRQAQEAEDKENILGFLLDP